MITYDYLLVGLPRTGTTSLWKALNTHPQVKPSKTKETSHYLLPDLPADDNFIDRNFKPNKNTKVFIDGAASSFLNKPFIDSLRKKSNINTIKCIFVLRNPLTRIYSSTLYQVKRFFKYGVKSEEDFVNLGGIDYKRLEIFVNKRFYNSKRLLYSDNTVGLDNILLIKMSELSGSFNKICDFLKIEKLEKRIGIENKNQSFRIQFEVLLIYKELRDWFLQREEKFLFMINDDNNIIEKHFGIRSDEEDFPQLIENRIWF